MTVSWITSLLAMRCGIITMSHIQNVIARKLSRLKVMCTIVWDRKGVKPLDFLEVRQTINSDCYIIMLTKLKARASKVQRRSLSPTT